MSKTYWHFAAMKNGEPVMRDGTPIEIGRRYTVPDAKMCKRGFHGSPTPLDALEYAPGPWVSKREILVTDRQDDKVVGTECVHVVGADATEVLRKFASKYLEIRDQLPWSAAWAEVWAVARDATWDSARDAARAAMLSMAKTAVWDPAWFATWDAARRAAWDAAMEKQNRRLARMLNALLRNE